MLQVGAEHKSRLSFTRFLSSHTSTLTRLQTGISACNEARLPTSSNPPAELTARHEQRLPVSSPSSHSSHSHPHTGQRLRNDYDPQTHAHSLPPTGKAGCCTEIRTALPSSAAGRRPRSPCTTSPRTATQQTGPQTISKARTTKPSKASAKKSNSSKTSASFFLLREDTGEWPNSP